MLRMLAGLRSRARSGVQSGAVRYTTAVAGRHVEAGPSHADATAIEQGKDDLDILDDLAIAERLIDKRASITLEEKQAEHRRNLRKSRLRYDVQKARWLGKPQERSFSTTAWPLAKAQARLAPEVEHQARQNRPQELAQPAKAAQPGLHHVKSAKVATPPLPDVNLRPGQMVEIRRTGLAQIGVILCKALSNGRLRYISLLGNGEVFPHSADDVQYLFPKTVGFPEQTVKEAIGVLAEDGSSNPVNPLILISEEMVASGNITVQARRTMSRRVRELEIEVERRARQFGQDPRCHPQALWELFVDRQPSEVFAGKGWASTTTDEVLDAITGDKPRDWVDRFTVHRTLMNRPELFQAQAANMRLHARFAVRPRDDYNTLRTVTQWIRDHQNRARAGQQGGDSDDKGEIDAFIRDSKHNIELRRAMLEDVRASFPDTTEAPTFATLPGYILPSASSQLILSCLEARLLEQRGTQVSPYPAIGAYIMKASGLYPAQNLDEGCIHRFLTEAGYIDAWDSFHAQRMLAFEERNAATVILPSRARTQVTGDGLDDSRHDFGDLPVYVIDDATAQELDDGISIEDGPRPDTTWIHVHVADPTHWIRPSDPVAARAQVRGSSLYLPDQTVPLLDRADIMTRMSLGAARGSGNAQPAMTFSMLLDAGGGILDYTVRAARIRNVKVVSYSSVDTALGATPPSGNVVAVRTADGAKTSEQESAAFSGTEDDIQRLRQLHQISKAAHHRRLNASGIEAYLPTATARLSGLPARLDRRAGSQAFGYPDIDLSLPSTSDQAIGTAAGMVQECMILAGRVAGKFCRDEDLAVAYRGAPAPFVPRGALRPGQSAQDLLQEILDKRDPHTLLCSAVDLLPIGLFFQSGEVSITPVDHWSLAISAAEGGYTRVTSPLRRYGDLLGHWQIKARLAGLRETPYSEAQMRSLVILTDERDKRVRNLGRTAGRYWVAKFLQEALATTRRVGHVNLDDTEGIVVSSSEYSLARRGSIAQVYLPELGVQASWIEETNVHASPQDRVRFRLDTVTTWPAPGVNVMRAS